MNWLNRLWRRHKLETELDRELRFHLDEHTDNLIAQGLDPQEARRRARLAPGGPEQVKEQCRDARGTRWLEDLWQDLRFGARMLRKNPGFTLVAVLTLALGIGANTAIFSIVNAVLLQPYPQIDTDRWVYLWERQDVGGMPQVSASVPNYRDWRQQSQSFSAMVLWMPWNFNLSGSGVGEPTELEENRQGLEALLSQQAA
ncbi:MAG: permease prefix domain 1-containing protein [Blastocatellia bacterium]